MERLVKEAEQLAEQGVRELILVARNNLLRSGSLREKDASGSCCTVFLAQDPGHLLDPDSVLLSGGDLQTSWLRQYGQKKRFALSGYSDSACQ